MVFSGAFVGVPTFLSYFFVLLCSGSDRNQTTAAVFFVTSEARICSIQHII